jgi:putative PIN family toxin of toxin-antitoxin system
MPDAPRLVVDTNVLVSRLLFRQSVAAEALRLAMSRSQLIVSSETLLELEDVLSRPKFDLYLTPADRMQFFHRLRHATVYIDKVAEVSACRDPKDDKFLALALAGHASLILSGDQDLLVLHPFRGINILTPRHYLEQKFA